MSHRYYVNNAPQTTLAAGITSLDTSISLASLSGFPASFPYTATIELGDAVNAEVVLVTAAAGAVATVTRGYNGTVAVAHSAGKTFDHTVGEIEFREANDHVNATSGVHGLTGAPVGTTDVQTVSNKTLTSSTLASPAVTGTLAGANETLSGTLGVTGAATFSGAVNANGAGTGLAVAHNETVGGTLGVTGHTSANGGLTVVGGETVDTVNASGLITASGGINAGKYVQFPSFTTEAAATAAIGTPADGQQVYLSAPTGGAAGVYTYYGGSWNPPTASALWQAFTPSWTASTMPTLGNGTLVGRYVRLGPKTIHIRTDLTIGSTTNGGGGAYFFALPFQAATDFEQFLNFRVANGGGSVNYPGLSWIPVGSTTTRPSAAYTNGTAGMAPVQGGAPVLNAGSALSIWGIYETA